MNEPQSRRTYVVVLGDYVVLQDISDTIAEHDPGSEIVACSDPSDAIRKLRGVDNVEVAFIEADPLLFGGSDLARLIEHRVGRIVLLGDAAEEGGARSIWPVLRRPFRAIDVKGFLRPRPVT